MSVLAVLALLGTALSAELDPSLTEWREIKDDYEKVMFPLKEYILEVKAYRPDEYDTNPPYGELFRTDKPTTMMAHLYTGGWEEDDRVGELVWNTIAYDRGFDIAIDECDARYEAYNSFPAGGAKEQIWAWDFYPDYVELTCNGELQYEQNFNEGEDHIVKKDLPEKCRKLGDAEVDRIIFKFMKGEFIRGRPKRSVPDPTDEPLPDPEEPTPTDDPGENEFGEIYPTCECWTAECNFCSNLECTVEYDVVGSSGIQVVSKLYWRKLNSLMLYNKAGDAIGSFQWGLGGIYLTGCVRCQSPSAIRKIKPGTEKIWVFTLAMEGDNVVVRINIDGVVVWEQVLPGECAEAYKEVSRFAFFDTTCKNTFLYTPATMALGARITPDCAGTCPVDDPFQRDLIDPIPFDSFDI